MKEKAKPKPLRGDGFRFLRPRGRSLHTQIRARKVNQSLQKRGRFPTPQLNLKNLTPIRIDTSQSGVGSNPMSEYPEPAILPVRRDWWVENVASGYFQPMEISSTLCDKSSNRPDPPSCNQKASQNVESRPTIARTCSHIKFQRVCTPLIPTTKYGLRKEKSRNQPMRDLERTRRGERSNA